MLAAFFNIPVGDAPKACPKAPKPPKKAKKPRKASEKPPEPTEPCTTKHHARFRPLPEERQPSPYAGNKEYAEHCAEWEDNPEPQPADPQPEPEEDWDADDSDRDFEPSSLETQSESSDDESVEDWIVKQSTRAFFEGRRARPNAPQSKPVYTGPRLCRDEDFEL